jgi:hypothetical protein
MTLNELAIQISKFEGKKKQVNIAQIKEILKVLGGIFASLNFYQFVRLVLDIRRSGKK